MINKSLLLRYFVLAFVLLVLNPLVMGIFLQDGRLHKFQSLFQLQMFGLFIAAFFGILVLSLMHKRMKLSSVSLPLLFASVLCFVLSFSAYGDFDKILNEGVDVIPNHVLDEASYINFESSTYLNIPFISRVKRSYSSFIMDDEKLKKEIFLDEIPSDPIIRFHTSWQDFAVIDSSAYGIDDGELNSEIKIDVNGHLFDITHLYLGLLEGEGRWIDVLLPDGILAKGANEILFYSEDNSDLIKISSQEVYKKGDSYKFTDSWNPEMMDFIMFVPQKNDILFSIFFKMSFIFKIVGIFFLIFSVFSFVFFKKAVTDFRKETLFSSGASVVLYFFYHLMAVPWEGLSKATSYLVYFLLKISFLKPFIDVSNNSAPVIGTQDFAIAIADVCSGIEGMAIFALLFFILVSWKKARVRTTISLFIIGITGVFLLNVIRIYFLMLFGAFISANFALTLFHSTAAAVLFIIYFFFFSYCARKYVK